MSKTQKEIDRRQRMRLRNIVTLTQKLIGLEVWRDDLNDHLISRSEVRSSMAPERFEVFICQRNGSTLVEYGHRLERYLGLFWNDIGLFEGVSFDNVASFTEMMQHPEVTDVKIYDLDTSIQLPVERRFVLAISSTDTMPLTKKGGLTYE
jgi:hypothetical protein